MLKSDHGLRGEQELWAVAMSVVCSKGLVFDCLWLCCMEA